jgi:RNA polymerase sigma factor (TIGR02999 family)
MSEVTRLLNLVREGDQQAAAELLPVVYQELRRLARSRMAAERAGHTLQATALVHEAYLRLVGDEARDGALSGSGASAWDCRGHFFAAAAEAMRRILIEHARAKKAIKRGGNRTQVELDYALPPIVTPAGNIEDLLEVNDALDKLGQAHPEKAELVTLLYFAGLNLEDAAAVQGVSRTTAYRHWLFARAWLFDAMGGQRERASR